MQNLIDPLTADLIFTIFASAGILMGAALTLLALPWTDAEIAATEAAADRLLQFQSPPIRIRSTR